MTQYKDVYSILITEGSITINVGETKISNVPSLELAHKFINLAKLKWPGGEVILNDNNSVSLVGYFLIQELIDQINEDEE